MNVDFTKNNLDLHWSFFSSSVLIVKTRELPGDVLVNIWNEKFFTENGNIYIYREISVDPPPEEKFATITFKYWNMFKETEPVLIDVKKS